MILDCGFWILDLKKKAISVRWRFLSKIVKSHFEVFGQPLYKREDGGQRAEDGGRRSEGGVFVQPLINPRRNHTYPDPFRKKARNWVGCAFKRGNLVWQNFVEILWYNHPNCGISTTEDHCWTQLCDPKRRKVAMWFGEIAGALW